VSEQRPIQLAVILNDAGNWPTKKCALCGNEVITRFGLQLCLLFTGDLVCSDCGSEHTPTLVSLIQLAETADIYMCDMSGYREESLRIRGQAQEAREAATKK